MEANAIARSTLFYNYIDSTDGYYSNKVEVRYRSRMNIPFRICNNEVLEKRFIAEAAAAGLLDLFLRHGNDVNSLVLDDFFIRDIRFPDEPEDAESLKNRNVFSVIVSLSNNTILFSV